MIGNFPAVLNLNNNKNNNIEEFVSLRTVWLIFIMGP